MSVSEASRPPSQDAGPLMSFTYARRHGVLLLRDGHGELQGHFRAAASPAALAEAQRRAAGAIRWHAAEDEAFDGLLNQAFEREG